MFVSNPVSVLTIKLFSLGFLLLLSVTVIPLAAQHRCGTVPYTQELRLKRLLMEKDQDFEQWLRRKVTEKRTTKNLRQQSSPYKIPVVVHVIHNGEPVGFGANISDAQIQSQITVLNLDFQRKNADTVNTPAEFKSVAGSMDIEFVLAKSDPEGQSTTGIVRVNGGRSSWTMNDNYTVKSKSYWPSKDYLNIWVCNLTDFLGYVQFPVSNLPGLENSSNNELTDGVVIWHRAFGSIDYGAFNLDSKYNKGRTVTHEISHFFGLRHIWGDDDGSCSGTDYVADTPNQSNSSSGCPVHPRITCSGNNMVQNFQDYTDDACMNLFTKDQMSRMAVVIENSPRRASLLTSPGLQAPAPVPNDLGIRTIISPFGGTCSGNVTPSIEVRNYGTNSVSSAQVRYRINGVITETKNVTLSLSPLASTTVSFAPVAVGAGNTVFTFEVVQTNGVADGKTQNNSLSSTVSIPEPIATPFVEDFRTMPDNWVIQNPDQQITWELAAAPDSDPANLAAMLNFFDYEDAAGELDVFFTPVFNLSTAPVGSVTFDVAYAPYQGSNDRLQVYVITGCQPLSQGTLVYDKTGASLATTPSVSSVYTPKGESDWRREFLNISSFLGQSNVQLAFVATNDWGNRLYIDNISVVTEAFKDVSLKKIVSPSVVTCNKSPVLRLLVQNMGTIPINSLTVEYSVNGGPIGTQAVTSLQINQLDEVEITLPAIALSSTENSVFVKIAASNGSPDENPTNDTLSAKTIVNQSQDRIPLRENFENGYEELWTIVRDADTRWLNASTNYGQSVYVKAYNNPSIGDATWLVSPVLDFSRWEEASMIFDLSYRTRSGKMDDLTILASRNCGETYENVAFSLPAFDASSDAWKPASNSDWNDNVYVNLSTFRREKNVRIAFVVTNKNGNNLYIDNVEFLTTAVPDEIITDELYTIFGYNLADFGSSRLKIKFNLPERQDQVTCRLVDTMGRIVNTRIWRDVLNQTHNLDWETIPAPGVYIIQLIIGQQVQAERVMIGR